MVQEYRCVKCSKLLAKDGAHPLNFEIKCLRCGTINSLFFNLQEQIIITDVNETILFVNEFLEQVTGYSAPEVIGKTPALWGGQMPPQFYEEMRRIIRQEKRSLVTKVTNRHKSGRLYKAVLRISPILNCAGDVEFFVGMEKVIGWGTPSDEARRA